MKIIEICKAAFEDYKTVHLLKKMFKPFGIEVRCNFVLVELWSIEYNALLFIRDNIGVVVPARIYLSGAIPYLQDVGEQFMIPRKAKPTNSWDKYSFFCDNMFFGCKSIEEMLIKADLMSK